MPSQHEGEKKDDCVSVILVWTYFHRADDSTLFPSKGSQGIGSSKKEVSGQVSWCFTPSQPLQLYQDEKHRITLNFKSKIVLTKTQQRNPPLNCHTHRPSLYDNFIPETW